MGKEGIRVVLKAFEDENIMQEQVPEAAAWYLEDYRFIYANMEDEVSADIIYLYLYFSHQISRTTRVLSVAL